MFRSRQTLLQSNIFRKSTPATIQGNNEREWFDLFQSIKHLYLYLYLSFSQIVPVFIFVLSWALNLLVCISACAIEWPRSNWFEHSPWYLFLLGWFCSAQSNICAKLTPLHWIIFDCLIWHFSSSIITIRSYHRNYCRQRQSLRSLSLLGRKRKTTLTGFHDEHYSPCTCKLYSRYIL